MASQQKQPRYRTRAVAGREPCRGPEVWTPDLVERIAAFLPRNEVAVTLRLVNMATAALLSTFKAVRVAEPLPAYCYEHSEQYPPLRDVFRGSAKRRKQLVRAAARSGSLEVVDVALEASGLSPGGWLFAAAAGGKGAHGAALALCKRLLAMGCPSEDSQSGGHDRFPTALEEAAAAGNADVCAWLLAGGRQLCQWDKGAVYAAARSGHAGLVFWLQSHPMASAQAKRSFCVDQLLTAAAHGCKLPDLQRIYQHWLGSPTACWLEKLDGLMRWHCGEGTDQLLGSCRNELCRIFRGAMSRPDGVSRVRLLWEERGWRPGDGLTAAVGEAATRCDAAAVAFLFEELGAEMQADDMYGLSYPPLTGPIQAGDLRFLQLMLRTYRVRCRSKRFYCLVLCAAEAGHLAILRWLFEWAAERERVQGNDVPRHYYIEDALQNGLRRAIRNGHAAAVRFLLGQGARLEPGPPWWLEAARSGSVETLRVLAESGYAPNAACVYEAALEAGDRRVLREVARLGFTGCDAAAGLTALLGEPDVPPHYAAAIPAGAKLTIITDACHRSATISESVESTEAALVPRYTSCSIASSSQDEQTSASTIMAVDNKLAYRGAFTTSLITSLAQREQLQRQEQVMLTC
eukprot:XP_001693459.1 predicted protein [Chlamydomonas reinhardtii]